MAPQWKEDRPSTGVKPGEFPFPLGYGTKESRYLTWLRNHSNYMAVRGLIDYVRLVAVLIRGALLNALITVPWLLGAALLIAADRVYFENRFTITMIAIAVGIGLVLLWPIATHFLGVYNYRSTRMTGSETTAETRDKTQTVFAVVLIAIFVAAAGEALASMLDGYHQIVDETKITFPRVATVSGAALAAYSVADRILDKLGGRSRQFALLLIGGLGVLVPTIIVMHLAHFVIFDRVRYDYGEYSLWAAFGLLIVVGLLVMTGLVRRALSLRDTGISFLFIGVFVAGLLGMTVMWSVYSDNTSASIEKTRTRALHLESQSAANAKLRAEFAQSKHDYAARAGREVTLIRRMFEGAQAKQELAAPKSGACNPKNRILSKANCDGLMELATEGDLAGATWITIGALRLANASGVDSSHRALADSAVAGLLTAFDSLQPAIEAIGAVEIAAQAPSDSALALAALEAAHQVSDTGTLMGLQLMRDPLSRIDAQRKALGEFGRWFSDWVHQTYLLRNGMFDQVGDEFALIAAYTPAKYPSVFKETADIRRSAFIPKLQLFLIIGFVVYGFTWLVVDVNQTSVHGLWRDRLAAAFLVGADRKGDIDIEEDIDLPDLSRHEAGSVAPYHLINVALNLHASDDIDLRDRRSDFFIFSKRFTGSRHTGYCRSDLMERVFPHMGLGAAMAISAAAASPNMGRETNPALVALMTLLNVRLGVWVPNPGRLQESLEPHQRKPEDNDGSPMGFSFFEVFREELPEIQARWSQLPMDHKRELAETTLPSTEHGLIGLAFSGGGIRSATLNLGIVQALHERGVFDHVDYLSTVSGGGFVGSSISSIMRAKAKTEAEFDGVASVSTAENGEVLVTVAPKASLIAAIPGITATHDTPQHCRFTKGTMLRVKDGERVYAGQRLVRTRADADDKAGSWGELYRWRVPPRALLWELMSKLDEKWKWVNVSDGGHIENLATMELLRRRCKYIIMGDGEADPTHRFTGLATVIRTARLDLGIEIDINVDPLRLDANGNTKGHWAAGTITYPPLKPGDPDEYGLILYFKSSVTGNEDEVIREYRRESPTFPHESTADQSFTEGQFEAYRSLGEQIADSALKYLKPKHSKEKTTFKALETWMKGLGKAQKAEAVERQAKVVAAESADAATVAAALAPAAPTAD